MNSSAPVTVSGHHDFQHSVAAHRDYPVATTVTRAATDMDAAVQRGGTTPPFSFCSMVTGQPGNWLVGLPSVASIRKRKHSR